MEKSCNQHSFSKMSPLLDLTTNAAFLLRLCVIIYSMLVVLSFFIFVSIGVMMDRFTGVCPLYAVYSRGWVNQSASRCHYPMVIAILFQLLYLLFRLVLLISFCLGRLTTEMFLLSDKMEIVYTLVDAVAFSLTFIGACMLSAGTASVCSQFNVCEMFNWLTAAKVAQVAAWLSTFIWLFIAIWGILFVWRTGKISSLKTGESSSSKEENQV